MVQFLPMENNQPKTLEMIRKDAIIPIEVGAGFYSRLQQMLAFMVKDKTEEEIKAMQDALNAGVSTPETWHYHYDTLLSLCQALDSKARELNLTVSVPIDSVLSEIQQSQAN